MSNLKSYLAILILFVLLFASCSSSTADGSSERAAEISMLSCNYIYNTPSGLFSIKADKLEIYSHSNKQNAIGFEFTQKDDTGKVILKGKGGQAMAYNGTEKVQMKGGVELEFTTGSSENHLFADEIEYVSSTGDINAQGEFSLSYNGLQVEGVGVEGNIKTGTFKFFSITNGSI